MKFVATDIPGVIIIEPQVFRDDRGFFLETFHREKYIEGGIDAGFVQKRLESIARDEDLSRFIL